MLTGAGESRSVVPADVQPGVDTYARSASIAHPIADGCRSSSVVAFGYVLVVIGACCFCASASAQTPDSRTADEPTKSWTATIDVNGDNCKSRTNH